MLAIFLSQEAQAQAAAPPPAAHAAAEAGYQAFARRDFAGAVANARRAVQLAPQRRDWWLLLAQAHIGLAQFAEAEQALAQAGQASGDEAALTRARADLARARGQAAGTEMYAALQAGDLPRAIASGQQAVQFQPDNAAYRLVLIHALLRGNRHADADRVAGETIALLPDSAAPLALRAVARQSLNRAADAAADMDRALQQRGLDAAQQRQLRLLAADLALAQGNGPRALDVLQSLPADDADAAPRREWARQRVAGGGGAYALAVPAIDCGGAGAAQSCTVLASASPQLPGYAHASQAYAAMEAKDYRRALEAARLATAASPAQRDWQLLHMNAALAAGETEEARRIGAQLQAQGSALPPRARLDLAYLSARIGDDRAASAAFRQADEAGALPPTSLLDAGYAAVRARRDDEAVAYFKRAVDAANGLALKMEPQMLYDTRRMISEVSRKWGVLASLTLRNGGNVVPSFGTVGGGPSGQRTAQAGVEAYWRPWGYRNGQFVELFARGFATLHNEAGGLEGGDSFQGGLGVRWKPLTAHNVVLSLSRVFGPNVNDDWLAQVGYSLDLGTDLRVDTPSWWTTRLAAEVGRYLSNETDYGVASIMFGRSFLVGATGRTVLYPHGVLAAEYSSTDNPKSSIGAGPGISVRHWFREDAYHAPRSYWDMTLQYRARLSGDDRMKGVYFNTLVSY